jgi:hypothetical protein
MHFDLHDYVDLNQCKIQGMIKDQDRLKHLDEQHLRWLDEQGAEPSDDWTVGQAIQVHKPPVLKDLAYELYEQMKTYVHPDLILTYWFSTVYNNGDFLTPHTDRPCCSISLSVNINQIGDEWPIYVWDYGKKNYIPFLTDPGDGVIYSGHNTHHRNEFSGVHYHQLFVHTVLPNTEHYECEDTQRTIKAPCSFKHNGEHKDYYE